MNIVAEYIDKIKFTFIVPWLITALLLYFASRYLKEIFGYVLMTLYEIFIGSEHFADPY